MVPQAKLDAAHYRRGMQASFVCALTSIFQSGELAECEETVPQAEPPEQQQDAASLYAPQARSVATLVGFSTSV